MRIGRRVTAMVLASLALVGCGGPPITGEAGEVLKKAWDDYRLAEFNRAIKEFDYVIAQTPEHSALHLQALYGLGNAWQWRDTDADSVKGRAAFEKVIELAPKDALAAWSQLALARMVHLVPVGEEPDYPAVRQAYQLVIDHYPGSPPAQEALIYQQSTLAATLKKEDAQQVVDVLRDFMHKNPQSHFTSAAWSLLATCYSTLGEPDKRLHAAVKAYETMEVDPKSPKAVDNSAQYWSIATIAEFEAGDFATARTFYQKLMDEYPEDQRVYGAQQAMKRMAKMEAQVRAGMSAADGAAASTQVRP